MSPKGFFFAEKEERITRIPTDKKQVIALIQNLIILMREEEEDNSEIYSSGIKRKLFDTVRLLRKTPTYQKILWNEDSTEILNLWNEVKDVDFSLRKNIERQTIYSKNIPGTCWCCGERVRLEVEKPSHLPIIGEWSNFEPICWIDERKSYDLRCEYCKDRKITLETLKDLRRIEDERRRDKRLFFLKNLSYQLYLKTWHWQLVKELKAEQDRKTGIRDLCIRCKNRFSPRDLQLHHLEEAYKYRGEEERHLDLLEWLCAPCHRYEYEALNSRG